MANPNQSQHNQPQHNQPPGQAQQQPSSPPRGPQNQPSKSSNSKKFLVIGLVVFFSIIPVLGCLAALSIPAFMTYMNRAKVAEAEAVTQQLADEVVRHYSEECEFPASLPPTGDVADCCGGNECRYDPDVLQQWQDAGLTMHQQSGYLVYETEQVGKANYEIRAVADFGCDDAPNHTITVEVEGESEACEATAMPQYTENEFE